MVTGSCLCGAVSFRTEGPFDAPKACHCRQCRKQSGHVFAATEVPLASLHITGEENLRWYRATPKADRGFCGTCGSFLFWRPVDRARVDVALGALEAPTGLRLAGHLWTAFKGDYYEISDGLPQDPGEDGA